MMLDLPPKFVETIQNTFGAEGKSWLDAFPSLLDEACQRWGLTDIQLVPNLSYNFVAMALSGANDSERTPAPRPGRKPIGARRLAGGSGGRNAHPSTTGFDKLNPPLRTK